MTWLHDVVRRRPPTILGYDPGVSGSSDPPPEARASDANRERVVEVLRRAASHGQLTTAELEDGVASAYAARTRGELERLTADVSVEPLADAAPALTGPVGAGVRVRGGQGGTRWVVSIIGGHDKRGRWRVASRTTVLNLVGGSDIDLNDAELSSAATELNIYSIMGACEVRVPHGVDVHVSGFALIGGNEVRLGDEVAAPGRRQFTYAWSRLSADRKWPAVVSRPRRNAGENASSAERAVAIPGREGVGPPWPLSKAESAV